MTPEAGTRESLKERASPDPAHGPVAVEGARDRPGLLHALLASIDDAVFVVRPDDRVILMANPSVTDLFGLRPESVLGESTRMLYASDEDFLEFSRRAETALQRERIFRGAHRFMRADGSVFEAEVTTTPVDIESWTSGVVTVVRDVSPEREAVRARESLLLQLEERVKELRGLHGTATILADQTAELEPLLQRLAGALPAAWQRPEATGIRIRYGDIDVSSDGYRESSWTLTEEFTGEAVTPGSITASYMEERLPPGAVPGPFLAEEEALIGSLAFLIGSHVRSREAREAAERDRDRFMTLFHSAPMAMSLAHPGSGRFVEVNEHWEQLAGYPREQLIGRTALELGLWPNDRDYDELRAHLDREGSVRGLHVDYRWAGAEPRVGLVSIQRIELDRRGLWFAVLLDRTTEEELENERRRIEKQKRALERLGALGDLAGGVAHDFNNLLLPILINVELTLPQVRGDARVRLEEIREAVVRGRDLTKKLRTLGRSHDARKERMDLSEFVRESVPILRRLIPESIEIDLELDSDAKPVSADPLLVEQALLNLVGNAAAAISGKGTVTIKVHSRRVDPDCARRLQEDGVLGGGVTAGDYTYLEVEDDGCGVPESIREEIFEPFFTTREGATGTGLGLSSVLGIVSQHDGHLTLDTEVDVGTRVRIGLPVRSAVAENTEVSERAAVDHRYGAGRQVLVVEDDDAVRRVTVRVLEAFGFEVTAAADPREAVALVQGGSGFHLVISDMVMPGMTGLELRDAVRQRGADIPVLFVSGYSADVLAKHGVDKNSVRILEKPFSPDALADAVVTTLLGKGDSR